MTTDSALARTSTATASPRPALHPCRRPAHPGLARPRRRPGLGAPGVGRAAGRHRRAVRLGARRVRLGEHVLLGRRAGRLGVLEGVVLRLLRRRELDHRRQDAARAVADGADGAVFGLSSWSILLPQALEGVAAVALLHATVRRTTGSAFAGLLGGVVLATTPVAVLMFRFNNPDALLVLLMIGSVYATLRACRVHELGRRPVRVAGPRRRPGRAGVPDQDAAGVPRAAGAGARLPARANTGVRKRIATCWSPAAAMVAGRRLVDRDRLPLAGVQPAVHRRLAGQLDPRADAGLQRLRPAHRRRDRVGRWWRRRRRRRRELGRDRDPAPVRQRDRRPGRLAGARGAGAAGGRALVHPPARAPTRAGPASWSGAGGCSSPA